MGSQAGGAQMGSQAGKQEHRLAKRQRSRIGYDAEVVFAIAGGELGGGSVGHPV